jgi:hypothetical protein
MLGKHLPKAITVVLGLPYRASRGRNGLPCFQTLDRIEEDRHRSPDPEHVVDYYFQPFLIGGCIGYVSPGRRTVHDCTAYLLFRGATRISLKAARV